MNIQSHTPFIYSFIAPTRSLFLLSPGGCLGHGSPGLLWRLVRPVKPSRMKAPRGRASFLLGHTWEIGSPGSMELPEDSGAAWKLDGSGDPVFIPEPAT